MSLFPPASCPADRQDRLGAARRSRRRRTPRLAGGHRRRHRRTSPRRAAGRRRILGRDRAGRAAPEAAKGGRASLEDAQAAAAPGRSRSARSGPMCSAPQGLTAAQMLVTLGDLEDRRRYLNAAATLDRLLGLGVVPVLNENDSVATEEIRFGDNDRLAARVAQAAGAGRRAAVGRRRTVRPQPRAPRRGPYPPRRADRRGDRGDGRQGLGLGHGIGRHGLEDRRRAHRQCRGRASRHRLGPDRASARHRGSPHACSSPRRAPPRARHGSPAGITAHGTIHVDAGAARALGQGKSLLAAGATRVEGSSRAATWS
jgi:glutamate 5-kinase